MVEEESGYIIKDEKGNIVHPNNKMAHFFYPNYKCYLQKKDSEIHEMRIRVFYEDMGCPDFMQKNKRKKTFVCDSKVLHLKFAGMDSWDKPVYKDDVGTLWKDVDSRAGMKSNLCISVNNEFDGEPDTGMKYLEKYQGTTAAFKLERIVWQQKGEKKYVLEKIQKVVSGLHNAALLSKKFMESDI